MKMLRHILVLVLIVFRGLFARACTMATPKQTVSSQDGLSWRTFPSFCVAAKESGMSQLYGGIHFQAGNEPELEMGRCIVSFANALQTWK